MVNDYLFVESGDEYRRIPLAHIICLEWKNESLLITMSTQVHVLQTSLNAIMPFLPGKRFLRANLDCVVGRAHIQAVGEDLINLSGDKQVAILSNYRSELLEDRPLREVDIAIGNNQESSDFTSKYSFMQDYFFIRADRQYFKIRYDELLAVEALNNYVRLVCKGRTHMALLSLRQLEDVLPADLFCRISRSCIIALDCIVCFDRESVTLEDGQKYYLGETHRGVLESRVRIIFSDVRRRPSKPSFQLNAVPMETRPNEKQEIIFIDPQTTGQRKIP